MDIKEKIKRLLSEKYEAVGTNLKISKDALKDAYDAFKAYAEEVDAEAIIPKISNDFKTTQKFLDELKKQNLIIGVEVQHTKFKDEGLIHIDLLLTTDNQVSVERAVNDYMRRLYIKPGVKRNLGDTLYSSDLKAAKKKLDSSIVMRLEYSDFSIE